jgi:signal peptidase II
MNRIWERYRSMLVITGSVVIIDQLSKAWVRSNLDLGEAIKPLPVFFPSFRIMNWENDGSAFGLMGGSYTIYVVLSMIALIAILFYFPRVQSRDWSLRWCLIFLMAGISGNFIDRIHQGYVTDLITFYAYYVFNIADLSNLTGVLILFIGLLTEGKRRSSSEKLISKQSE